MDSRRFDTLTRISATSAPRRVLIGAFVGAVAPRLMGDGWKETAAKKRRKKKKKKKPVTPCATNCPGNQACLPNGECGCRDGSKRCPGDVFDLCHACCPGAGGGLFAPDCDDNLDGEHCVDSNGDNIYLCGCLQGQQTCGDGECVACCTHQQCREITNDEFRVCVGGICPCAESAGFFECPDGSFHEGRCRHTSDDAEACGPTCDRCDPPRSVCGGGKCCFPSGQSCDGCHTCCCSGELSCGPGFICA